MNFRAPILNVAALLGGSRILKNLDAIKQLEAGTTEALKAYQDSKLCELLLHAFKNVPFYKEMLAKFSVVERGQVNLEHFSKLPIMTKDILRADSDSLMSQDCETRKWFYNSSGGSTGQPVKLVQDKAYSDWNFANKIYYKTFAGQNIGDKELRLWGSDRDLSHGREHAKTRVINYLYNRRELNTFKMTQDDLRSYVRIWNDYKPRWVESYVDGMFEFASFIEKDGACVHSPKGILTSTGTLYPEIRDKITSVFGCKVYNRYGSREVGDMACSCGEEKGMHTSPWNHHFEILDDNLESVAPGEMGKVYVTTLNNYSMPLLRYDIGDFARRAKVGEEQCACGRASPVVEMIEGREMSIFKTREGRLVPGQYFIHFLGVVLNKGHIKKFQMVQRDYDDVLVKVVLSDQLAFESSKAEIETITKDVMGKDCEVHFDEVDDISPLDNGKYLYTVCEID